MDNINITNLIGKNSFENDKFEKLLFLPSLHLEAMNLLSEAHAYFVRHANVDKDMLPPNIYSIYSREISRITVRLTSILAWTMARKAVAKGEISNKKACERFKLTQRELCEYDDNQSKFLLPRYVMHLLNSSLALYKRIARLDDEMRAKCVHDNIKSDSPSNGSSSDNDTHPKSD